MRSESPLCRRLRLLLLIPIFLFLASCGGVAASHARRAGDALSAVDAGACIETMQLEAPEAAGELLTRYLASVELPAAADEIESQRAGGNKLGERFSYALTLRCPDVTGLAFDEILTDYPEVSWTSVTRESYSTALRTAFYGALGEYLESGNCAATEKTLSFHFDRAEHHLTAVPDETELKTLCRGFLAEAETLFQEYRASSEYTAVVAAERVNKALAEESEFPTIFQNTRVVRIESKEDGSVDVTLDTVNYTDLFTAVSEEVYADYNEKNPDGVYAPPEDVNVAAMLKAGLEKTEHPLEMTRITLEAESGQADDISAVIREVIDAQLEVEVDDFTARVRENMIRESVSEPRTQVKRGTNSPKNGVPFKIYTPNKYDSHYIKINNASTGDTYMTVYIREGDSITVYLPVGQYRIRYATGSRWYGWDELFGPDGDYLAFKETISIKKDNKYTLTLYQQTDSNLTTKSLTREGF